MQKYNPLLKLITNDGGHIKVNKKLITKYGIETAVTYSELLNLQIDACKKHETYLFNNTYYFSLSTEKLSEILNISAHKQRTILQKLQDDRLIEVFYSTGNTRLINVSYDVDVLYEILNPENKDAEFFFENLLFGINDMREFVISNLRQIQKRELSLSEDDFSNYIKKYSGDNYSKFESKLFEFLLNDDCVKKEFSKSK